MLFFDVMIDGASNCNFTANVPKGFSKIEIRVPRRDLAREESYEISLRVIIRDGKGRLISKVPGRHVTVRSKFDLCLNKISMMSARFTNPRAPAVEKMIKTINATGIDFGITSDSVAIIRQAEAIYEKVCDLNI